MDGVSRAVQSQHRTRVTPEEKHTRRAFNWVLALGFLLTILSAAIPPAVFGVVEQRGMPVQPITEWPTTVPNDWPRPPRDSFSREPEFGFLRTESSDAVLLTSRTTTASLLGHPRLRTIKVQTFETGAPARCFRAVRLFERTGNDLRITQTSGMFILKTNGQGQVWYVPYRPMLGPFTFSWAAWTVSLFVIYLLAKPCFFRVRAEDPASEP